LTVSGYQTEIEAKVLEIVRQTMLAYRMVEDGDRVLVGVSGGPDSVALLNILMRLKKVFSLEIGVAHFNHGIRKEDAKKDASFVSALAGDLALPFYLEKGDVPRYKKEKRLSMEQAARHLRYDFFSRVQKDYGFDRVAVGHHLDDNAELVLMALLRGSGPLGLSGIPPVRNHSIIRPLIRLSRREISGYLKNLGLKYVEDQTNHDTTHLRNKIRHKLLPLLKNDYNPGIMDALNRLSGILRQEEDWIHHHLVPEFESLRLTARGDEIVLSSAGLKMMHPAPRRRIIRMAIAGVKGDLKKITLFHIDAVAGLVAGGSGFRRLDLPDRILVIREGGKLIISKEHRPLRTIACQPDMTAGRPFAYEIGEPCCVYIEEIKTEVSFCEMGRENIPDICSAGQNVAFFDMDKIKLPLILRNFQPGDRFVPQGLDKSVCVKTFLKKRHVPENDRHSTPVLLDSNGIIWVLGHRVGDSVKVTAETGKVLVSKINRL
jgi:tRNA(Ile)-lysidine synthase